MSLLLLPLLSAVVTFLLLNRVLANDRPLPMDQPNERSLHTVPVPRVGGVCILGGIGIAILVPGGAGWPVSLLLAMVLFLAAISFIDDLRGVPFPIRLVAHLMAAAAWTHWTIGASGVVLAAGAIIAIAWMTNLFNFMDGSDGLAGGMTAIGFTAYAIAAAEPAPGLATFCAVTAAAAVAFLFFNFHPARVFMGDAGSVSLGFLAGAIGVLGWQRGYWPFWFPALVFAPFVIDASITLLRRLVRGERVWQAHREHYYQRLVRMGWGHRGTALAEYATMVYCAMAALVLNGLDVWLQWGGAGGVFASLVLAMKWIDSRWSRFQKGAT